MSYEAVLAHISSILVEAEFFYDPDDDSEEQRPLNERYLAILEMYEETLAAAPH